VKMLLLAKLENRPARLDLTFYPYLPAATVGTTDPRAYLGSSPALAPFLWRREHRHDRVRRDPHGRRAAEKVTRGQ
jgi:hypothetical protein